MSKNIEKESKHGRTPYSFLPVAESSGSIIP